MAAAGELVIMEPGEAVVPSILPRAVRGKERSLNPLRLTEGWVDRTGLARWLPTRWGKC